MNRFLSAVVICALAIPACSKPSTANIALRKENQALRDKIATLERQHDADAAALRGKAQGTSTSPTDKLFTVAGLSFGRLTGAAPDGKGLRVYVVPSDTAGEKIKAAGSFVVEAFDLKRQGEQRIGKWDFPIEQAAKNWFGQAMLYTYVLEAPWQTHPEHGDLTLKVTFTDGLTGRVFEAQKQINIQLAPK
jgi:hypothetical protein